MITMRGISRFIAETLDTNAEFIALCMTEIGQQFDYVINIDPVESNLQGRLSSGVVISVSL